MLGRCLAGIVLGLPLSMAVIGIVVWAWPGGSESVVIPALVAFFPLWIGVMAASYLFASARRAWGWLALGNVGAVAVLLVLRHHVPGL